jgi:hypothetical protein
MLRARRPAGLKTLVGERSIDRGRLGRPPDATRKVLKSRERHPSIVGRLAPMPDLDDEYHEYLWGEASPRAFARKAKFGRSTQGVSRRQVVRIDASVDSSSAVPR